MAVDGKEGKKRKVARKEKRRKGIREGRNKREKNKF